VLAGSLDGASDACVDAAAPDEARFGFARNGCAARRITIVC
jgi:hypothetical protein